MNAVKNNPYRTLGVFGNSTEKELQKQIATIKRFAEVGKSKSFDYDFPFFGDVVRSIDRVQEAASKIEQAKNKVHYALFWFLNNGHIDEAALNNLKEGHIEKAAEIWEKTLKDTQVTPKNFTSVSNLSTLQLGIVTKNGSFDPKKFTASIELKGKLILSEVFNNFIATVIGEGLTINRDIILKDFADEVIQLVKPYLNKTKGINSSQLINAFNSFPTEIKQYVSGKFVDRPISYIESQIDKSKQYRDDNPGDAEEYGEELFENTKEDLTFLKKVLGANNVQYQMIVNKLANEILQCSIDFFNYHNEEGEYDPFDDALKLVNYANEICPTGQVRNRVDESLSTLEKMRFQDAYQIINFLNQIFMAFDEVERENSTLESRLSGRRVVINEDKIMSVARPLMDNQVIKKIATSEIEDLIDDFYNSLYKLITKISYSNKDFFEKKKKFFIDNLPITNRIKAKFEKEKFERQLREAEKELKNIQATIFLKKELDAANIEMNSIKQWEFLRSQSERERQINEQQAKINQILKKAEQEKSTKLKTQQDKITSLKQKLKDF
jgi:hypothetical protein